MKTEEIIKIMKQKETFVPEHMREGYIRYINNGIDTGSFGMAIIQGNKELALLRADFTNINHIDSQIEFFRTIKGMV